MHELQSISHWDLQNVVNGDEARSMRHPNKYLETLPAPGLAHKYILTLYQRRGLHPGIIRELASTRYAQSPY